MSTVQLSEEMLKSHGWAYLFDLSHLKDSQEDTINEQIRNIYFSAVNELSKQRSKKIKKGPFVVWNCMKWLIGDNNQPTDGYVLFVTPFYHKITGRDVDPIVEEMWKHKGYIRASSAIPILEGAIPACLYEEGEVTPVEMDKRLLSKLSDIFEEHQYMLSQINPGMELRANPYEN
ncbi:hypothetical protein [Paenibacillus sp. URB8-2]|uniref:hypothetical protein n=1 Tax=Paenibacillus sp. URB8-2 TaxID=2741301 RepID=UPI0015BB88A8|nr:hypothetical protein [Paenibacillus sp. URB8-2]BCG58095.1 hypothetical protein PUR_15200 [Paenibacillus sp. URB8-2]